jgi:ORF6N domain-containing protein
LSKRAAIAPAEDVQCRIASLRDRQVILDTELAAIYRVEVRALLQAIRRNASRFPKEFVFQVTALEAARLRSQSVISKPGRGGRRYLPFAFTEHGALMASTVLNSPRAVKMSIFIIRAFVRLREQQATNAAILKRLAEIDKSLFIHDASLRDIYQQLRPLLEPAPEPPKRQIGYHTIKK